MDTAMLDSHKLIYHPERVADWLSGAEIYPLNAEVGLSGACNHRCVFCSFDYMDYKSTLLPADMLIKNLVELGGGREKGLKSVLLAGTGEPLLHSDFVDIVHSLHEKGLDVALSTNGVLFTKEIASQCLTCLSWIRFSVSAGCEESYKKIQRGRDGDFQRVLRNIADAAEVKADKSSQTNLGVQLVLIPENMNEAVILGEQVRTAGADMYYVKAYGVAPMMRNDVGRLAQEEYYEQYLQLKQEVENLSTEKFRASFRIERMEHLRSAKPYNDCFASPFHVFIAADGKVYPCCQMADVGQMCFGDLHEQSLIKIWHGEKRHRVMHYLKESKLSMCTPACKLDVMNRYCQRLKKPEQMDNFI